MSGLLKALPVIALAVGTSAALAGPRDSAPSGWYKVTSPATYTGTHVSVTDNLTTWRKPVGDQPGRDHKPFDRMRFRCHGGRADITWYVGNLEPEVPSTGMHLSIELDGKTIATLLRGSHDGVLNDVPAVIRTIVGCPKGEHELAARMAYSGSWNVPYANADDRVQRGFIVEEFWGAADQG